MISGQAYIIDGDTLAIGETKIRLQGIEAAETDPLRS
jgi:endonuclease YncB( thermonuclease family)